MTIVPRFQTSPHIARNGKEFPRKSSQEIPQENPPEHRDNAGAVTC